MWEIFDNLTCINQTPIEQQPTLNKVPMWEIFDNLTCISRTPVYSETKFSPKEVQFN
jgi:hypothetical protein